MKEVEPIDESEHGEETTRLLHGSSEVSNTVNGMHERHSNQVVMKKVHNKKIVSESRFFSVKPLFLLLVTGIVVAMLFILVDMEDMTSTAKNMFLPDSKNKVAEKPSSPVNHVYKPPTIPIAVPDPNDLSTETSVDDLAPGPEDEANQAPSLENVDVFEELRVEKLGEKHEVDHVRLSYGEQLHEVFLHFTVISSNQMCDSPSVKESLGDDQQLGSEFTLPNAVSTQFPSLSVLYWSESGGEKKTLAPSEFVGCFIVPSHSKTGGESWSFFVARLHLESQATEHLKGLDPSKHLQVLYQIGTPIESASDIPSSTADPSVLDFFVPLSALLVDTAETAAGAHPTSFLVVGDLGENGREAVLNGMFKFSGFSSDHKALVPVPINAVIHVGDMSYASNSGECYNARNGLPTTSSPNVNSNGKETKDQLVRNEETVRVCRYDCLVDDSDCKGRSRIISKNMRIWRMFFDSVKPLMKSVPWMTTMGNHDNDLVWFLKYRPPHRSSFLGQSPAESLPLEAKQMIEKFYDLGPIKTETDLKYQQGVANALMKHPYFFSFTDKLIKFISLGSEDNPINAYEMSEVINGSYPLKYHDRFEQHFGKRSPQYKWLENELKTTDRKQFPWIVVYTHRPLFQSSNHHQMCTKVGDWFGCHFRNTYTELLETYHVNLVLSGHAHHYQRSKKIKNGFDYSLLPSANQLKDELQHQDRRLRASNSALNFDPVVASDTEAAPIYVVIGTGGYRLDNSFPKDTSKQPDWIDARQSDYFGFVKFDVINASHLLWKHIITKGEAEPEILDEVYITQSIDTAL